MAIDLKKIENLQIDEGTLESPFILKDSEVTTLYKLALSNNRAINIKGVVNTTTGTILKHESYQIKKAWPELTILATEVTTQDWSVQLLPSVITELETTTVIATNISVETLRCEILDVSLTTIDGSYGEGDVRRNLHFDNITGKIYYEQPTSNAGWTAAVRLAFYPSYIEEPTASDYRIVPLEIRAIAVTSVTVTAPSRIDENATVSISLAPYPANNTKAGGVKYSLSTAYGRLSPNSGVIVPNDTFTYYAPAFDEVPATVEPDGTYYEHIFSASFYMFGSTTASGSVQTKITMRNQGFTVEVDRDSLLEGEKAQFTVNGYLWEELQKTIVVNPASLVNITEEELLNRVAFESGPFFAMNNPIDNATFSADVVLYIAPPGADPLGKRAEIFNMSLRAIGITTIMMSPQTIGQFIDSIISIEYRPLNHTKGGLSYSFACDGVTILNSNPYTGTYKLSADVISQEGHDATIAIYSDYIGTGIPLIQAVQKLYVQDRIFKVTFDGSEQRTITINEGATVQCYTDILHISELRREIIVKNLADPEHTTNEFKEFISNRIHFSDDVSTDLIWVDNPTENLGWDAEVTITFIAKYVPEGGSIPYSQTVTLTVHAVAVNGVEWQDIANDFNNYQIATAPLNIWKKFKLRTLPYNNTKQLTLEQNLQNLFSIDAIGNNLLFQEIGGTTEPKTWGEYRAMPSAHGDWLIYGNVAVFADNPDYGTITKNITGDTRQDSSPSTSNVVYPKSLRLYDKLTNEYIELRKIDSIYADFYTCVSNDAPITPIITRNVGKVVLNDVTSVTVIDGSEDALSTCFYVQVGNKKNAANFYNKVYCSHFSPANTDISISGDPDTIINYELDNKFVIRISNTAIGVTDIAEETSESLEQKIEAYIAWQYNNGTPITIYYPLEEAQDSEYINTLYRDYVFFKTLPYHIYTANNPANQCSVEFVNNSTIAVNRTIFGNNQSYQSIDSVTNKSLENYTVDSVRINPSDISSVPFFAGTPTAINQYDEDGNLLLDINGNPEKGEVNIFENFSGKYEEWTDNEFAKITWDIEGDSEITPGSQTPQNPIYPTTTLVYTAAHAPVRLYGLTLNGVRCSDKYAYSSQTVTTNLNKYEFTGNESLGMQYASYIKTDACCVSYAPANWSRTNTNYRGSLICSHLVWYDGPGWNTVGHKNTVSYTGGNIYMNFQNSLIGYEDGVKPTDSSGQVIAKIKEYLAAQKAAGTPVTIWYASTINTTTEVGEYYTIGNTHCKYTISKLTNESDAQYDDSGNIIKENSFNKAFVYNEDGSIPSQFFLSRYVPGWNQNDNTSTISMAKGLQAQPRSITKDSLVTSGCYYTDSTGELRQISSLNYGAFFAYLWLAYITYGTINLKTAIGTGASKLSPDGKIFVDDSGTAPVPGQQYDTLFILNNALLTSTTYMNYDFNLFSVKDIDDIAKEPVTSYKIASIDVGGTYTAVSLADKSGTPVTYTALYANEYYSLNACYSETGYSEDNYRDNEGHAVVSGYGTNTNYNDNRHPVRCLNVENMWGCGNYIINGTGFIGDDVDKTIVHPLLWNPQSSEQLLNDISTWDILSDFDVVNKDGTWDIGSVKYYKASCGWANQPAGNRIPYRGYSTYSRPTALEENVRYNWSTGNYYDWTEESDTASLCGIGQTSLLKDNQSVSKIVTDTETYYIAEYITQQSGYGYIDVGITYGLFVHDIQFDSAYYATRQRFGLHATSPYWGHNANSDKFMLNDAVLPGDYSVFDRHTVTLTRSPSSNAKLTFGNTTISGTDGSKSFTYRLFGVAGVQQEYCSGVKLYELAVYNDNKNLIARMLPCHRASDNAIGMYDVIRQKFYAPDRPASFRLGPAAISIDSLDANRYLKINRLVVSRDTPIDTSLKLSQNTKFIVDFESSHTDTISSYFGGTKESVGNKTGLNLYVSTDNKLCCEGSSGVIELSNANTILPNTRHTIEVAINDTTLIAKIDGIQTYAGNSYELDTTTPYSLFMVNEYGLLDNNKSFIGKIYSFKMYKNNRLAREYIPIYDKKDGLFGLYDNILKKFSSIQINAPVIPDTPAVQLPRDYQQVEYIESSGTQYINTGVIGTTNTAYLVTAQAASTTNMLLFGSRTDASLNNLMCALTASDCLVDFGDYQSTRLQVRVSTDKFTVYNSKNLRYINNTQSTATYSGSVTTPSAMRLLDVSGVPPVSNTKWKGKLFVCKVWENDVLLRDFVPCCRKADNEIGLYDIINNEFYTNAGTGAFSKGPDILAPDENKALQPVDYIKFSTGQYIDTGWKYKPNSTIKIVAQKTVDSKECIVFGSAETNNALKIAIDNASNKPYATVGTTTQQLTNSVTGKKPYTLTLTADTSSFSYLVKGAGAASIELTAATGLASQSTTCLLGGCRSSSGGVIANGSTVNIYLCMIYENDTLVRYLVPRYNVATDEYGFYDTVNDIFYGYPEKSAPSNLLAANGALIEAEYVQNTARAMFENWNFDTGIKFKDTGKISVELDVSVASVDGNNVCINGSLSTTAAGSTYLCYSSESVGGITLQSRIVDESKVTWVYLYNSTDNATIHIGGSTANGTGTYNYKRVTIYGINGSTVLGDFVPAANGGFYDCSSGFALVNQGTTQSTVGKEIDVSVPGDPGMALKKLELPVRVFGTL